MRKLYIILLATMFAGCGLNSEDSSFKTQVPETAMIDADEYTGSLPCADCDGVDVSLQLNKDSSYIMTSVYTGSHTDSSSNTFKDTGSWNIHGADTLYLVTEGNTARYLKTDSTLIQLDGNGHRITGPLALKYILHKK